MASQVLTDCKLYSGEYDWSGDMNSVRLDYAAEMKDATTFGQTTRINKAGLKSVRLNSEGLFSAGTGEIDGELFGVIGTADRAVSVIPNAGTAIGDAAYLFRSMRTDYRPGAQVGELLRFASSAVASGGDGLVRGVVLFPSTAVTATSTSTKYEVGAVSATQRLYAALHVFAVSGTNPTLDVIVQSDANSGAGGETNRITFTQATAASSQWSSVAGAVTDTFWRLSYTIGGTATPTFTFAVTVGIL